MKKSFQMKGTSVDTNTLLPLNKVRLCVRDTLGEGGFI